MRKKQRIKSHRHAAAVFIVLAIGASIFTSIRCDSSRSQTIERFILISCDDLRADRLGCYGNPREVSPAIDALADESVRFTKAFIPWPFTPPSHSSMLTSLYPAVFDIPLDTSIPTAAGILNEHGFTTTAFTADGWMSRGYGMLNGFKEIDDRVIGLHRLEKKTENWLKQHQTEKFFLFLHTYYVHVPYHAPEEYFSRWADPKYDGPINNTPQSTVAYINSANAGDLSVTPADVQQMLDIYDAEIRRLDDFIHRIIQTLKDLDLYESTMLIVTSDHGEQFYEFGHFGHAGPKHPLADISTHVPMIIHAPEPARPMEISSLTEIIDLPPTLLDAAGIKPPASFQGRSLWPAIKGEDVDSPRDKVFFFMPSFVGIRTPDRKLTLDQRTGAVHLFDLERDPTEHRDVAELQDYSAEIPPLIKELQLMQNKNEALRKDLGLTRIKREGGLPSRALEADSHTVLLSPFDTDLFYFRKHDRPDAFSLKADRISLEAGNFGKSLHLQSDRPIDFPLQGPLLEESGAVEFWMKIGHIDKGAKQLFDMTFHYPENPLSLRGNLFWDWGGGDMKRVAFDFGSGTGDRRNSIFTLSVQFTWNSWHHIFLAWEKDDVFLLIDGVLEARRRITPHHMGQRMPCSRFMIRGDNCFLDDLRISDHSRLLRPEGDESRHIDPEVLERLKALGYIK